MKPYRWRRGVTLLALYVVAAAAGSVLVAEARTSWLQSELLSSLVRQLTFSLAPGAGPGVEFAASGPYDSRLGYKDLPAMVGRLGERGFAVTAQTRLSERHREVIARGAFPIYREKTQAGLTLLDHHGAVVFERRLPERIFADFDAIPPLVVESLLFIENRELLDPATPRRNPAVEWDRLAGLVPDLLAHLARPEHKLAGASTLATQMEKYRHAPQGLTDGAEAKLRQMVSASLRAYLDGPETLAARRRIVLDYLNSTPLSARPGIGEINGLGDGLWAWFGSDLDRAGRLLRAPAADPAALAEKARLYKQVLSLLLAQRRPSYYLAAGRADLAALADAHLRLLHAAAVIDTGLMQAALAVPLEFRDHAPAPPPLPYADRKAASAIRTDLLALLGLPDLYRLDRLDLSVETSLDLPTQRAVSEVLRQIGDPAAARALGLYGHRLLDEAAPGGALITSLTLYERGAGVNYLRVQADTLEQPFDIHQGAKLDLGTTAKLRTQLTSLEIVADLHQQLAGLPASELRLRAAAATDPISRWAAERLAASTERSLSALLEAALGRRYPASPAQSFFTGGGLHRFENFDAKQDAQVLSVALAFRDSVNLVFIRLMRDIVDHVTATRMPWAAALLADAGHPLRRDYLARFADREGSEFLLRFHAELAGLSPDAVLERLAAEMRPTAERLAILLRSVRPDASPAALGEFLAARLPDRQVGERELDRLYRNSAAERLSLNDRAYLTRLHPLELWLAFYLQEHAGASRSAVLAASAAERQESYAWLFRTRYKGGQDRRIRSLLEEEAFGHIHAAWQLLGYPFDHLVASYATSIGSSADRPDALAELVGIVLNDGIWQPTARTLRLHFGAATPYETVLDMQPRPARQLLAPEVAAAVRQAMLDVVENGTARRLHGAFKTSAGAPLLIGAKTGTGDHRRKSFAPGGRLIDAQVVSRTATVVFFIGDDLFGNLTVYAPGPDAAGFTFTSSLSAQLLKALAPALEPLLQQRGTRTAAAAPSGGA
jgi:membrane peptidoglycan carboxypeptidase